ncbi:hypothetical protein [Kribbella sp. NPDC055071]
MLTARTLAEAQIYVSLTTAADPAAPAIEPPQPEPGENLTEGQDAWTYTTSAGELTIPYASEDAARRVGAHFGLGVSELVDAAQWAMVAATFARRALDADLAYNGEPGDARRVVEANWEFAADAVAEALKFLPDGANDAPAAAVWTPSGTEARTNDPYLLTRAKLTDDLQTYRGTLNDFRALYGPA